MQYDILTISDLHWGVINENKHEDELEFIFEFLNYYTPDLIVIAGDYFDLKLYLNSGRTIKALHWFDRLYNTAKSKGVKAIRMFLGTLSHDADQLEVFRKYEDETGFFKYFNLCTTEETLPGLQCLYCPDEIMSTKKYILTYTDKLLNENDIGFFHGSFDVVLRQDIDILSLEDTDDELSAITSVTFPMNYFMKLVTYGFIGGHWHDGKQYEHIYYTGSPTRWHYNEDEPKGMGFIRVDTATKEYFYQKILNPLAPQYITFEFNPNEIIPENLSNELNLLFDTILMTQNSYSEDNIECNIRIVIYEEESNTLSQNAIRIIRDHYVNQSNIVIRVKSKKKKDKKKEKVQIEENEENYSFIQDKNVSLATQIYEFIKTKYGEEVPIEYIETLITKFSK